MEKATFSIEHFKFDKVNIDLDYKTTNDIFVSFEPKGVFYKNNSNYDLTIVFRATDNDTKDREPFINVRCVGTFKFLNVNSLQEVPDYFYKNSVAILFPYLRAYISLVTNQANVPAVILPTMNLSSLERPLRENSTEE